MHHSGNRLNRRLLINMSLNMDPDPGGCNRTQNGHCFHFGHLFLEHCTPRRENAAGFLTQQHHPPVTSCGSDIIPLHNRFRPHSLFLHPAGIFSVRTESDKTVPGAAAQRESSRTHSAQSEGKEESEDSVLSGAGGGVTGRSSPGRENRTRSRRPGDVAPSAARE